jgi:hypothetical protein
VILLDSRLPGTSGLNVASGLRPISYQSCLMRAILDPPIGPHAFVVAAGTGTVIVVDPEARLTLLPRRAYPVMRVNCSDPVELDGFRAAVTSRPRAVYLLQGPDAAREADAVLGPALEVRDPERPLTAVVVEGDLPDLTVAEAILATGRKSGVWLHIVTAAGEVYELFEGVHATTEVAFSAVGRNESSSI